MIQPYFAKKQSPGKPPRSPIKTCVISEKQKKLYEIKEEIKEELSFEEETPDSWQVRKNEDCP